ncbi:MAG: CDP-alcohol phosphatidyltransferase family protein [Alphaproteobacteria bacterium]
MANYINIPNAITFTRILLGPLIAFFIYKFLWIESFYLFLFAGVTDFADGFLARKFNCESELGKRLDPIADKILISCTFVSLTVASKIPLYLTIIIFSRDLLILIGGILIIRKQKSFDLTPVFISKINTVLQITFCLGVLYNVHSPLLLHSNSLKFFSYSIIFCTFTSFIIYAKRFFQTILY